jgi:hypothetical protein
VKRKYSMPSCVNRGPGALGLLLVLGAMMIGSGAGAQEKQWPESTIKIDPNEVRQQVIAKLNEKSKGAYVMTADPPAGFPVPIYPGVENSTYTARGQAVMSGTMKSKDPPATIINWYKPLIQQKGFTIKEHSKSAAEDSGKAAILTATKDDTNLTITAIMPSPKYSMVSITSMQMPRPVAK